MRVDRELEGGESFTIMRRSYIKSLTISRGPVGTVNGRERYSRLCEAGISADIMLFCAAMWQNL
jgi:hypothetical protein